MTIGEKLMSGMKLVGDKIRLMDNSSQNVTFMYRGTSNYKTLFGGIVSSLLKLIMIWLFSILFVRLIRKSNINTNQTRNYIDLHQSRDTYNISQDDLKIAYHFNRYFTQIEDKVKYLNATSKKLRYEFDPMTSESSLSIANQHSIELWDESIFEELIRDFDDLDQIFWI